MTTVPAPRLTLIDIERVGNSAVFAPAVRSDAAALIGRYPAGNARSALLPLLHLVQSEQGFVSADGIAFCAEVLELTKAQVAAVATFYTMYKRKPTGEYLVSVCTNTLCGLLGGDEIYATLSELLGVGMNETTADASITLEHAECMAACDYAPAMTVNYEFFDNQTVDSAVGLVGELRAGRRPLPTRGAPLCSFREISRQIAGFVDDRPASITATAAAGPTVIGVRTAERLGHRAPAYPDGDRQAAGSAPGAPASQAPAEHAAANPPAPQGRPTSANDAPLSTADSDPAAGDEAGHPSNAETNAPTTQPEEK